MIERLDVLLFQTCLSDSEIDTKSLEELFRQKAVDHTAIYAKANMFGAELFRDLPLNERKEKLESEVSANSTGQRLRPSHT